MRLEGADQLAVPAFRSQAGVHLEEGFRGQPHHLAGNPRGYRIGRFGDEDHVDVADVIQFARTTLAHRDDGQPGRRGVPAHGDLRDGQRSRQRGVGHVGKVGTNGLERQHWLVFDRRRQVKRCQHQQSVAVQRAQPPHHRPCGTWRLSDALGERGTQLFGGGQPHSAAQQTPFVRVGD
jgi:hypothetical protein